MAFDFGKITSALPFSQKKGAEKVIGIDIGSSAIKVVQLREQEGIPVLDTYGELQLGPYGDTDLGRTVRLEQKRLIEALVDILRESGAGADSAAVPIPYASSFAANISVEGTTDAEIAERVPVVARKFIPVSLTEVSLDWFPLYKDESGNRTDLLLLAIYNEALQRLKDTASGAGLTISALELESFSAMRGSLSESDTGVALVDMGAGSMRLSVIENSTLQKIHSLRPSGVELTQALAKATNKEFLAAEELKRSIGIGESTEYAEGVREMRTLLERGMREMDKVLDEYEEAKGTRVGEIRLIGSGALLPGLMPFMQDIAQRSVRIVNPFTKVAYPAFLEDTLKEAGPSFVVALGSAMRLFGENR